MTRLSDVRARMDANSFSEPKEGERYQHYKGGVYKVLLRAKHTETKENVVVYQSEQYKTIWVRPLSNWCQPAKGPDGKEIPRFVLIPVPTKYAKCEHHYHYVWEHEAAQGNAPDLIKGNCPACSKRGGLEWDGHTHDGNCSCPGDCGPL